METRQARHWRIALLAAMLVVAGLGSVGCLKSNNGSYSMGPSGPTPVPTPPTITAVGTTFSPTAITVASGTVVTFNVPGHTVNIDDSAIGSCGNTDLTSFPATHMFAGPHGAVFKIHCDFHSCGATFCPASCTGMIMTVTIS